MKIAASFCGTFLIGALLCSPVLADDCATARATTPALEAQRDLATLPTGDGMQTDVSAKGRVLIAAFKSRIDGSVTASMRCQNSDAKPKALEKMLGGFSGVKLPEDRLVKPGKTIDNIRYGDKLAFEVRTPQPGPAAIVARFGIECGEDTMLMIFERRGNAWKEILRTTGELYNTVGGGWWAFDYGISPRDKSGHWFVATKNVAPWCSSTWSELRYAVLRPGVDAAHPKTLFSKSDSIWRGADRYGDLKVDLSGFDLRWRAESMDGGVHNREWIAHYAIDGDRVRRTAPIAKSPRDFADEWVRLAWADAKNWTAVSAHGLKPLHDKLHKSDGGEYVSVRRCSDEDHTQVETEPGVSDDDTKHLFFQVSGGDIMMMDNVSFAADPHCKGPNLFDMNKAQ